MPTLSVLMVDIYCPSCNSSLSPQAKEVRFSWGYCPSRYKINDKIIWRKSNKSDISPPWTNFLDQNGKVVGSNVGDPSFRHILIRDFYWNHGISPQPCYSCLQDLTDPAVEIVDQFIKRAWMTVPGELDTKVREAYKLFIEDTYPPYPVTEYLVNEFREITPMPDWIMSEMDPEYE